MSQGWSARSWPPTGCSGLQAVQVAIDEVAAAVTGPGCVDGTMREPRVGDVARVGDAIIYDEFCDKWAAGGRRRKKEQGGVTSAR